MNLRVAQGIILGVALGLTVGVGAYTFVYARGYSYMTDNAEACEISCPLPKSKHWGMAGKNMQLPAEIHVNYEQQPEYAVETLEEPRFSYSVGQLVL